MKSYTQENRQRNVGYRDVQMRLTRYFDYNIFGLADNEMNLLQKAGKVMFDLYISLFQLKKQRMTYLNRKLRKHATEIQQKHRKSETVRFRWQKLCRPTSLQRAFNLDELRDLAAFEGIPEYLFQTKAELCTELAQRFERVIQGKAKVIPKCINTSSLMLLTFKTFLQSSFTVTFITTRFTAMTFVTFTVILERKVQNTPLTEPQ